MPFLPPLARAAGALEIIDGPPVPFADLACCMTDIARVNGWFFGRMGTMIHVKRMVSVLPADRVVTDGAGFGAEGFIRISYATSMEQIKEGVNRIKRFAQRHF
jgi:hypothetical protein